MEEKDTVPSHDEDEHEHTEFTVPPPDKDDTGPPKKLRWDKWTTIVAIGMSGLSLMIWVATVLTKP